MATNNIQKAIKDIDNAMFIIEQLAIEEPLTGELTWINMPEGHDYWENIISHLSSAIAELMYP